MKYVVVAVLIAFGLGLAEDPGPNVRLSRGAMDPRIVELRAEIVVALERGEDELARGLEGRVQALLIEAQPEHQSTVLFFLTDSMPFAHPASNRYNLPPHGRSARRNRLRHIHSPKFSRLLFPIPGRQI